MSDTTNKLQLRQHLEMFATRQDALEYANDYVKPEILQGEPVVLYYGTAQEPNMMIIIGLGNRKLGIVDIADVYGKLSVISQTQEEANASADHVKDLVNGIIKSAGLLLDENKIADQVSYSPDVHDVIIGDCKTLSDAVQAISSYVQEHSKDAAITAETTDTVIVNYVPQVDGGVKLSAEVKISKAGDSDDVDFNNNIITVKPDGIYATANLEYDDIRRELTFTTSGQKNGVWRDDANRKVISLGDEVTISANNEQHNLEVAVERVESNNRYTISADAKISEDEDNILVEKDGKLMVDGRAKNIKYKGTTVFGALNAQEGKIDELKNEIDENKKAAAIIGATTDTAVVKVVDNPSGGSVVTADVRLASTQSLVFNVDGLDVNVSLDIDNDTNTLLFRVGNGEVKKLKLPGVNLIKDVHYDSVEHIIEITIAGDDTPIRIPVESMLADWQPYNEAGSPVVLTRTHVTGEVDTLTASLKLRTTDNILVIDSNTGQLYVSERDIDNKVKAEADRAKAAEDANAAAIAENASNLRDLGVDLEREVTRASNKESEIETNVANNNAAIAAEVRRAQDAERNLEAKANANAVAIEENNDTLREALTAEGNRAKARENEIENLVTSERARALAAESALQTNITNASATAAANLAAVQNDLTETKAEVARINGELDTANQRFDERIDNLESSVSAEIVRSSTKDDELTLKASEALTKAQTNEVGLTAVNTTISETASAIRSEIANAKLEATNAHNALSGEVTTLDGKLQTEVTRATGVEDSLSDRIDTLTNSLNAEIQNREASDASLSESLNNAELAVQDTATASLKLNKENGNPTLSAEVKVDGSANNIIAKTDSGIFANVSLSYNEVTNILTFNNGSGDVELKLSEGSILNGNSRYDAESESLILTFDVAGGGERTITIPVSSLIEEWTVANAENNPVIINRNRAGGVDEVSVTLKLRSNDNLVAVDGVTGDLYVSEAAINDKIAVASNAVKDMVEAETARAMAAETANAAAAANADAKAAAVDNAMELYKTSNDARVESVESAATANATAIANEKARAEAKEQVLSSAISDETTRAKDAEALIRDSLNAKEASLIQSITDTNAVHVADINDVKTSVSNLDNKISLAEVTAQNNVNAEKTRAEAAEQVLATTVESEKTNREFADLQLSNDIATEKARAEAAEEALGFRINNLPDNSFITQNTPTVALVLSEGESSKVLKSDVKVDGSASNILSKTDNGLYANVSLAYNKATNILTFNNGSGDIELQLSEGSLLNGNSRYDAASESLVLAFDVAGGGERTITIPVTELIEEWGVDNKTNSPVELVKMRSESGKDKLSANLKLRSNDNLVSVDGVTGDLYVSEEAINNKVQAAKDAVQALVEAEALRAQGAEATNATAAANADTKATTVENALNLYKTANDARVTSAEEHIAAAVTSITDETARAKAQEQVIVNSVADEVARATAAEDQIKESLTAKETELRQSINDANQTHDNDIAEVRSLISGVDHRAELAKQELAASVIAEQAAREAADQALSTRIDNLPDNAFATEDTPTIALSLAEGTDGKVLKGDVKLDNSEANILKIGNSGGLCANVSMSYDNATNKLTFNDGKHEWEFQLATASILESSHYESETEQLVLGFNVNGSEQIVRISVGSLVKMIRVANEESEPVVLHLDDDSHVLTATLNVDDDPDNLISANGSLFASRKADNHTAHWGGDESDISVQTAINRLKGETDKIDDIKSDVEALGVRMADVEHSISEVNAASAQVVTQMGEVLGRMSAVEATVGGYDASIDSLSRQFAELKALVEGMDGRMSNIESNVSSINKQLTDTSDETTVASRLAKVEDEVENMVDFNEDNDSW